MVLHELHPVDRTPVIAEYLQAARRRSGADAAAGQARSYFGLEPEPTTDDIAGIVEFYPVFRVTYLS